MNERIPLRPDLRFWLFAPLVGGVTWAVHEFAHYAAGRALGYSMWMSMNQAGLAEGAYESTAHNVIVTMAGPLVTYVQAGVAFFLARSRRLAGAYLFLFFAVYMRFVAFGVSFMNPNDEARTSLDLGMPMWLLPSVLVVVLFVLLARAHRQLGVTWKVNLGIWGIASAVTAAIVMGDPVVGRILG